MDRRFSVLLIIVFNSIPVAGVAAYGWQPFEAFWFFWVETLIMAFFNTIRITCSQNRLPSAINLQLPILYRWKKGFTYLLIRIGIFFFYSLFIIIFIGFIANAKEDKVTVVTTIFFHNTLFNLGLLISIVTQTWWLVNGYFRSGAYLTASPDSYAAIFDGRQIVMHVAVVLGGGASIFLAKQTSYGDYSPLVIISLLCTSKCIFDLMSNTVDTNTAGGG